MRDLMTIAEAAKAAKSAAAKLDTNAKIRAHYLARYGGLSGIAQQYIYHYNRNVKR